MPTLTPEQIEQLRTKVSQYLSDNRIPTSMLKVDFRNTLIAMDQWFNGNLVSLNNSIPEPAKSALTNNQKLRLFHLIVETHLG